MAETIKKERTAQVFQALCRALDDRGWHYQKDLNDLSVALSVKGDDLKIEMVIYMDAERQLIRLLSPLPFKMCEDKRIDGALATCYVSERLASGYLDYNMPDGAIIFRMASCFLESQVSNDLFYHLIDCAAATADHYYTKFLALDKGFLSLADFMKNNA